MSGPGDAPSRDGPHDARSRSRPDEPDLGSLVRSRVDESLGSALEAALDRSLTGYGVCRPQAALLLEETEPTRLVFESGVPVAAGRPTGSRQGTTAVLDLVGAGPYRVDLYRVDGASERPPEPWAIDADLPARTVADDPALAERTRGARPSTDAPAEAPDPVESFLDDADRIAAIQAQAREEATRRAAEWGLDGALE